MRRRPRAARVVLAAVVAMAALSTPAWADPGPALTVDAASGRHSISPYIYGVNGAGMGAGPASLGAELGVPLDRRGGNNLEAYNWMAGVENTGSDYYFENIPDCNDAAHGYCAHGNPVRSNLDFVAHDRSLGAATLLGLPLLGFVARSGPLHPPFACAFPRRAYPRQRAYDPFSRNCGNGISARTGRDLPVRLPPRRTGQRIGPSFDAGEVRDLVRRYGDAAHGGVRFYELGNEPALWDHTHRPLHPKPTSYDELWGKLRDYGAAVKAADPTAQTLGFSEWAFDGYLCSAVDLESRAGCTGGPDRRRHGGRPLAEWLLSQFHADEQRRGRRLLDYLDVHYYQASDPSPAARSTEVTRSLWDPTYDDPSYISRDLHQRIQLIPRMRDWVARNYPGTRISLSEYNLGHSADGRTNALIQADTLGIFAREQLDLATLFVDNGDSNYPGALLPSNPVANAFRLFLSYDGAHSRFGDTYVSSTSADQSRLAVYGAVRSSDGALTVVVVNKSAADLTSSLAVNGATASTSQVWQWTGDRIDRAPDEAPGGGVLTHTFPARSMTMLVVR